MKRKSMLFGVLILVWVVFGMAFPAFADYTLSLEAKDGTGTVKPQFAPGEDLYVNIILSDADRVAGCAFTLNFDPNAVDPPPTTAEGLPVNSGDITSAFPFVQTFPNTQDTAITHRVNSEGGKIYFAGAEIHETLGGAKYGPGAITLFTVKFKVKNDALPGDFNFSLTQTELFNPAAGYGTDANSDGVYDPGTDTTGKAPVLVGALDINDPNFGGDLSDDFPVLLGDQAGALATLQLSVQQMVSHGDELVLNYGDSYGLWHYDQTTGWVQLNTVPPSQMLTADIDGDGVEEAVMAFPGYGLYSYDDPGVWTPLNALIPDAMVRHRNGLLCDFGAAYGLWFYSQAGGWEQFNSVDPDKIVVVDFDNDGQEELVVSFVGYGLYTYEPSGGIWQQINPVVPDEMICQGDGIAVDYGATYGLWSWSLAGGWLQRNAVDPGKMVVADIDDDGLEELVVCFTGYGLYYYDEAIGWQLLNAIIPDAMIRLGKGLASNFGQTYGLWYYDQAGGWSQWNTVPPDQMAPVDLDKDGTEELVATFVGYGLFVYDQATGWSLLNAANPDAMMCANLAN